MSRVESDVGSFGDSIRNQFFSVISNHAKAGAMFGGGLGYLIPGEAEVRGVSLAEDFVKLYRSVNHDEFQRLLYSKQFVQGPNSLEGKFFAEHYEDANKWGNTMNGIGGHVIVEVHVPKSIANEMMRWPKLDGIGPARYRMLDQLRNVEIHFPSSSYGNDFKFTKDKIL